MQNNKLKYRPKVIILYNYLFLYRIPVWNQLAKKCDLTVTYSLGDGLIPEGMPCSFEIKYLPGFMFASRFMMQKTNIRKLVRNYDAIIAYGDIAWLKYSTLPWFSNNKVIFHTIGVSASYEKKYDEHKEWDKVNKFFYKRASALAFYTRYPIDKFAAMGIPREKMFEAPNTVEVLPIQDCCNKDSILFIGTLYRQKGILNLFDSYIELHNKYKLPELNIIGKGPDFEFLRSWIEVNNMAGIIKLRGAIYDLETKAHYFAKALACISPLQAGLSVLESMGYGVPYVTTKDSFTGGELFNIHNGIDGVLMNNVSELSAIIEDITVHPSKYIDMGKNAKIFYNKFRKPEDMAEGLWNAISYAINH